jgi:hypothetical protein
VGAPNTCGQRADACHAVVCDDDAQICTVEAAEDGAACLSGDLCVENATCSDGQCIGPAKQCPPGPFGQCTTQGCNTASGECESQPDPAQEGNLCFSGASCMVEETCTAGVCGGGVVMDCSFLDLGCMIGTCDPAFGFCEAVPIPAGEACSPGGDPCMTGICDATGGCQPIPLADGTPCSDGDSCTAGEACSAGQCTGGATANQEVYFVESFASNAAGWQLGPEWEIGPALSMDGTFQPDPATDHSSGADNGVAGVVLGGDMDSLTHPSYFLTSPPIDVSAAPGPVYLELWRWLNADAPPYVESSIDVWNGTAWVDLWTSPDALPFYESEWTKHVYDLTAHKNAALRVRFGHAVLIDTFPMSGWNIDDVRVLNQACN